MNHRLQLFESPDLWAVTGPAIRPGGLELTERAARICDLPAGSAVLDAGCGLGATVDFLDETFAWQTVGLDVSPGMIQEAHLRQPKARLIAGAADRLPFPDGAMKAVFCECVLSLTRNRAETLREFARVLAPDGWLVLSDLYARNPEADSPLLSGTCLDGTLGRKTLHDLVKVAGFGIRLWEDHSDRLKHLAARLVFAHGSLAAFWSLFFPCGGEAEGVVEMVRKSKPGYYLLIARKEATS